MSSRETHKPHQELPSAERIAEYVEGAIDTLRDPLPAGEKLWKSWALDLADNVLALARKLDSTQEQLEAVKSELTEWRTSMATEKRDWRIAELQEQLKALERERDAIGAALGEPCAECGHIDWRSDGYADNLLQEAASWEKIAREYEAALAERNLL